MISLFISLFIDPHYPVAHIIPNYPPQIAEVGVIIKPKIRRINSNDFSKSHEAVLAGEKAAAEALPKLKEIVDKLRSDGRLN